MFFNLLKKKKNGANSASSNNSSVNTNNSNNQQTNASEILHEYESSRFTPLNIDLNKIELNKSTNNNNLNILTGRAKKSNIPIYTGNPFNPYF